QTQTFVQPFFRTQCLRPFQPGRQILLSMLVTGCKKPTLPSQAPAGRKGRAAIERGAYPFPMYCRLGAIGGLLQDKKLADQALTHATHKKTIVLWTLAETGRIYGQCNFMQEPQDSAHFKFCDTFTTVVHKDMAIFESMGVTQLLFVEEELM